jgi:hypothetical protein
MWPAWATTNSVRLRDAMIADTSRQSKSKQNQFFVPVACIQIKVHFAVKDSTQKLHF